MSDTTRPQFQTLPELPPDVEEAFQAFKLAILRHKLGGWMEVSQGGLCISLDVLKQVASGATTTDAEQIIDLEKRLRSKDRIAKVLRGLLAKRDARLAELESKALDRAEVYDDAMARFDADNKAAVQREMAELRGRVSVLRGDVAWLLDAFGDEHWDFGEPPQLAEIRQRAAGQSEESHP